MYLAQVLQRLLVKLLGHLHAVSLVFSLDRQHVDLQALLCEALLNPTNTGYGLGLSPQERFKGFALLVFSNHL